VIRQEGPQSHRAKAGTPTMGGLLIPHLGARADAALGGPVELVHLDRRARDGRFGAVGFADDYLKIVRRSHHGLIPRYKMGGQVVVALAVGVAVLLPVATESAALQHAAHLPVLQEPDPRSRLVVRRLHGARARGASNAVNLTDGLDVSPQHVRGIRGGVHRARLRHGTCRAGAVPAARALCARGRADRLLRGAGRREPRLPLVQLLSATFHGDVGSLALGGALGTGRDSSSSRELLLPMVGGVFVIEALSVSSRSPRSS